MTIGEFLQSHKHGNISYIISNTICGYIILSLKSGCNSSQHQLFEVQKSNYVMEEEYKWIYKNPQLIFLHA